MTVLAAAESYQNPWWVYPAVFAVLAVIGFLCWLADRILCRFFPSFRKRDATAGNALLRVEATLLPGREHVVEALERDDVEEDDQGDPPDTGRDSRHQRP
ncbi:MAG: hypothetical protein WB817_08805 [Terriglobales bacterium]